MAYSETTILAQIKSIIQAVDDVGQVHDYERWAADFKALAAFFKATIEDVPQLRGWTISLMDVQQEQQTFDSGEPSGSVLVNYFYRARCFMAVDDSQATEKTHKALVLAAATALMADTTLAAYTLERGHPMVQRVSLDHKTFAGVLVHYGEIIINPQEVI